MWPQWTFVILIAANLGFVLANDGRPHPAYDFVGSVWGAYVMLGLLYAGGFFEGGEQ